VPPAVAEYFKTLRDRLLLAGGVGSQAPRTLTFTSCRPGEGVSTVAFHLALTLARQSRVLLVDANLSMPTLLPQVRRLWIPDLPAEPSPEEGPMARLGRNLDLLTAAFLEGDERGKFDSPTLLPELVLKYRQQYEFVLFDAPPLSGGSTALRIGSLSDGVVLVVEAERTLLEAARRAKQQFGQVRAKILGVVLNKRRLPIPKPLYRE
jgi:Mrp family chromosome partitioning ATPase